MKRALTPCAAGIDGSATHPTVTQDGLRTQGRVRIGVEPTTAPHDWQEYKRLSGIASQVAQSLAKIGKEQGADPR